MMMGRGKRGVVWPIGIGNRFGKRPLLLVSMIEKMDDGGEYAETQEDESSKGNAEEKEC